MENQKKKWYLFTYALNHSTYALNVYTKRETEKSVNFHLFWLFSRSALTLIFIVLFQTNGKTKIRIVNDQQKCSGKSKNFKRLEFLIRLMFRVIRVDFPERCSRAFWFISGYFPLQYSSPLLVFGNTSFFIIQQKKWEKWSSIAIILLRYTQSEEVEKRNI